MSRVDVKRSLHSILGRQVIRGTNLIPARGMVEPAAGKPLQAFRRRQDQVHDGAPAVALSLDLAPEL